MLDKEEAIQKRLVDKFDFMKDKCTVNRVRRLTAEVPKEKLVEVMTFLKNDLDFSSLCTITGLDSGDNYEMIYHLANGGIVLNLKVAAPKTNAVFETVTELYNGATLYELEAHNLLGLKVNDIPEGIKYPLPDNWPEGEYPLRKDWKKQQADGAQQGE
jgi:membrane-bound hydrogenase subunit beta